MESPGSFRDDIMHFTQLSKIQRSVQLALDAVRHKKGAYDMTIRLGCLALNARHIKENDMGKKYKKEIFLKSIDGSVTLEVKKWLVWIVPKNIVMVADRSGLPTTYWAARF
jgi:hypothetical protein